MLKMKGTSKNKALLAQAPLVHNSLGQTKAWTLVSAGQLDKHSANTRCSSARAAQLSVRELQQGCKQQHCAAGCGRGDILSPAWRRPGGRTLLTT